MGKIINRQFVPIACWSLSKLFEYIFSSIYCIIYITVQKVLNFQMKYAYYLLQNS